MKRHFILIIFLFVFVIGCSKQVAVKGTVVFSDDGSPVTTGAVTFSTPTFQAQGDIDEQGRFTMRSYGADDGLPPGTYKVSIVALDYANPDNPYSLIDRKYAGTQTTDLEVTVEKAMKNYEIKVDRNPQPKPK